MVPHLDLKDILCIEPDREICVLLTMMLSQAGIKVTYVKNIEEAVRFLMNNQPALIIIENTFVVSEIGRSIITIKKNALSSKIIMVSSVGDDAAKAAVSAGADRFLTRPFSKSMLLEAVSSMMDNAIHP